MDEMDGMDTMDVMDSIIAALSCNGWTYLRPI